MLNTDIFSQVVLGIVSIFSHFISALSGGGAGLIQLPALLFFGLPFSKALATHKVASVALGLGASVPHLKRSTLQWNYAFFILISGIPGVLLGAYSSSILPGKSNGNFDWVRTIGSQSHNELDNATSVKVDEDDNALIVGTYFSVCLPSIAFTHNSFDNLSIRDSR